MRKMRIDWLFVVLVLFTSAAHGQATYKVLYNFGIKSGDPWNPQNSGIIAQGRDGKLYSTANQGGAKGGSGAVFKITPAGMLTVLHTFSGTDGLGPSAGLTLGTDGNFYGTTSGGGFQLGTIFKITAGGSLTTLYSFTNGADGSAPTAPPIQGIDGKFYGTASNGNQGKGFYGSVYKVTSSGTFTVLHSLTFDDGAFPFAPLVQGTNGNFYGTTLQGSPNNEGTAYKITPSGEFGVLFNFDGTHGHQVAAPLVQGSDGNFYGTTVAGGTNDVGVVFKITPTGAITVLHSFTGSGDGADPYGGLVQATDGNFYGTTSMATGSSGCGTIFRISSAGKFKTLYTFPSDGSKGCNPQDTLLQHTGGILFGDTFRGGTGNNNHGVFYSLNAGLPAFASLLPYSGKVGKTIEFLGQGFNSSTTVSFNGTAATPTVISGTYLTAAVPSGATTGLVTVTTSSGTLKSNKKFRVTPQITGFKPTSGPVGTLVTITGVSLAQTTQVTFSGVKASFKVVNDTKVTATVPSGAVTGKIAITTPGGTAVSSGVFTVT
jgi:uncharacterized repeat protein (TIGR03803 family)